MGSAEPADGQHITLSDALPTLHLHLPISPSPHTPHLPISPSPYSLFPVPYSLDNQFN
ncbi:hypothetical protein [Moorena producens]|uniref:hypothetical protein n=1 Tax=Moorena producens TaxID=1155739 RepID=UPI000B053CE9|nr:hypothetical protein [Moorena producens]